MERGCPMRLTSESDNHPDTLVVPTRRRVAVANLELGMFVCELDRPWSETNFAFQDFHCSRPTRCVPCASAACMCMSTIRGGFGYSTVHPPPWRRANARPRSGRSSHWPAR